MQRVGKISALDERREAVAVGSRALSESLLRGPDTDEALTVYKSKIEAATVDVDGVRDVTDCTWTFGGTAQSGRTYTLDIDQIPTLGGVTCG